jgi:hypothetical protein
MSNVSNLTRPRAEQVSFKSARTGAHGLDDYLEQCELGDRTVPDLLAELLDARGVVRPDLLIFRTNPASPSVLEYRIGTDASAPWQVATDLSGIIGTFSFTMGIPGQGGKPALASVVNTMIFGQHPHVTAGALNIPPHARVMFLFDGVTYEWVGPDNVNLGLSGDYTARVSDFLFLFDARSLVRVGAINQTLQYVATAGQTVQSLAVPDQFGKTYTLAAIDPFDAVTLVLNGVTLALDDSSGAVGDWRPVTANNTVVFTAPLQDGDEIQIELVPPPEVKQLGATLNGATLLESLDTDWDGSVTGTAGTTGLQDGTRTSFRLFVMVGQTPTPMTLSEPAHIAFFVDGVRQRPTFDYSMASGVVTFAQPPRADAATWGLYYPFGTPTP